MYCDPTRWDFTSRTFYRHIKTFIHNNLELPFEILNKYWIHELKRPFVTEATVVGKKVKLSPIMFNL